MKLIVFAAMAMVPTVSAAAQSLPADSVELGRKYVEWFLGGRSDSLFAMSTETFQQNIESLDWYDARLDDIVMRAGARVRTVEDRYVRRNGAAQFWYTAEFQTAPEAVMLRFVITPEGLIDGVGVNLASQAPPTDP